MAKKERYEVLFEDIKSQVQQVLEGHSALLQEIQGLRGDIGGMRQELRFVEKAVTETKQGLGKLVNRFDLHERAHAN